MTGHSRFFWTLFVLLSIMSAVPAAEEPFPNVLFIMVDEMRWDALAANRSDNVYKTPALDRLAAEGTRFTHAYTVAAVCVSSRHSFFTSRYSHVHGATDNQVPIRTAQILLPGIMKQLGYETAISGKLHFSPNDKDYDFDYFRSFGNEGPKTLQTWPQYLSQKYTPAQRQLKDAPFRGDKLGGDLGRLEYPKEDTQSFWITDRAVEFLHIRDKSKPFFLFVSYLEPHSPSHLAEPYWSQFLAEKDRVKLPSTFVPGLAPKPEDGITRNGRAWVSDPEIAKSMTAAYHAKVKHVDDNIERLLDGLKKAGLDKNTLIIFTADHGNMLGDHNRWFKGVQYEGSIRIPLLVKAPENSAYAETFNQGKTVSRLIESIDVMPTLLDIIGKPLPDDPGFQGKSFTKLVAGNDPGWKNIVYSERRGMLVRDSKYKLIKNEEESGGGYLLFDLENDPEETQNLAGETALQSVFEELKKKLDAWQKEEPPVPKYPGLEPKFPPAEEKRNKEQRRDRRQPAQ
ncbi:MAG: sulfatase-like hydrolase/transferase [Planctomycetaceae bacterium]|nr:sulfatase-like hydrolase/transferase [Planctomycetaceae bacterium]